MYLYRLSTDKNGARIVNHTELLINPFQGNRITALRSDSYSNGRYRTNPCGSSGSCAGRGNRSSLFRYPLENNDDTSVLDMPVKMDYDPGFMPFNRS
jgi:hypothetical protein